MKPAGSAKSPEAEPADDGNDMQSLFTSVTRSFMRALFPPRCYACGAFIRDQPGSVNVPSPAPSPAGPLGKLLAPCLCRSCIDQYSPVESPICPCCGKMFAARSDADHWCGECLKHRRKYSRARSAGLFEDPLLTLIHRLKYHGRSELAGPLGKLLYHAYTRHWADRRIDWIVPVPLHSKKRRRRGFNQARLLVARWPEYPAGGKKSAPAEIRSDLLCRVRYTASQTGLGRQEREQNLKGAFELKDGADLTGRSILLIDDVFTTGSTVTECAKVLRAGGAGRVDVLTLARAGG
ncbi:MAG: hypothetical protein DSY90_11345 [Deltaproteobacteria bacterium]|nr:MAG: hypothetical protein DSY90_11345 [Deltaproteobacteria bacterium]